MAVFLDISTRLGELLLKKNVSELAISNLQELTSCDTSVETNTSGGRYDYAFSTRWFRNEHVLISHALPKQKRSSGSPREARHDVSF